MTLRCERTTGVFTKGFYLAPERQKRPLGIICWIGVSYLAWLAVSFKHLLLANYQRVWEHPVDIRTNSLCTYTPTVRSHFNGKKCFFNNQIFSLQTADYKLKTTHSFFLILNCLPNNLAITKIHKPTILSAFLANQYWITANVSGEEKTHLPERGFRFS